ncbi:unnamed protein product [Dicrocoelium dendriticum]|nr:unnamed protein product [Dicrocoelium dendriticum]
MAIEPGIAEGGTFGTAPLSVESEDRQRTEALATKSDDTTGYLRAPAESVTSGQSLIAQRIPQVPDVATVKERSEGEQLVLPTGEVVRGSVEAGREPVPPYDEAHRMAIEPGIAEGGTFGTAPLSVESEDRQRSEALATKSDDTTGYLRAPAESVTSGQSLIAQRIPQVPDVATVKERSEGEQLVLPTGEVVRGSVEAGREPVPPYDEAHRMVIEPGIAEGGTFGTAPLSVESDYRQRSEALATKSDDTTGYLRAPAESVTSGQSLIAQRIPQVPDVATVKERSEGEQLVLPTGEVVRGSVEAGREPVPPYDEAHRMAIEPGIAEGGTFGTAPLSVESDYRQRSEALATKSDDTTGYLRAPAESVTSGQSLIAQRIPQVPDVATVKERSEGEQLVLPTGEVVRGSVEAGREPVPPYDEAHRMAIEPGIAEGGTFGTAPLSVESDYRQRSEALATKSDDTTGYLRAPAESVTSGQSLIAQRIPQVPDVATVKERSEGEQLVLPTGEVVRGSVEAGREPVPPYDEAHRMAIEPGIAEGGTFGTAPLSVESDYRQRSEALATKSDDTTGYLRAPAESVTSGQSLIAQRIPQVPDVATVKERSEGEQLVLPTGEVVRGSVEAGREPVPSYDEASRMGIEQQIAEHGSISALSSSAPGEILPKSSLTTPVGIMYLPSPNVSSSSPVFEQSFGKVHQDKMSLLDRASGRSLIYSDGEHSRNETTRDGRVWETCMKTADIPFYVDLPSHDSFGESEAAKSRVCEETDAEYVSKEASEQHVLMHTTRESDERRLSSTGFHIDQLTDFSPGTSRPSPEGIPSDLPTHLAEAKPFSHERLLSAMSHVAFSRDDDGGIKYQSQSVVEIGKYEPVIGQPTLTGARSVEYRDENFQFEVPLPKERASEDNKPGKAAPFEPTIDAISSLKPSICDVHADLTVYPDSAKHPWRNAKQIVQPDLKYDTGPFADSPSMSKTHKGQTAIKSATRMSFPSPSPVDYVSGVHSGSPSPIQLIPVTSRPCSAMSIRSTIHTELTLGSDRLAPPLVSSITTLQLDSPQYGYSLSATHENVKRAHSHESSLNKITLPNPPFCPYRHNELLVNSDHSIKSDMVPPKRIWGNIDSNMRGKRGQIAKITTHTTLSDTGPCLGLVSRLSTEIIFVPEGIVINTLSSSAQMLTDQIRKYHSATPVQLDAKAEPGTPKQLGLKTVTGGSPESAVYVNNDQVEKNVVRVLRDVSTVEVEGMESLTMDTLMISREIAIASNQECELEWSGLDSGTLGTVPCVTEQPDRRSSSKFPTSLQPLVENEARTSPQLVPTTYSQAEAAYRQKIEAEYFPASRKSLEQQWNLDSSSLVGSTSRSRAARQGRELSQEWKTLESEGDSKMTSFLLTSTIDILCQSEPSDPHSSASKLVQERPAQQKVSRSEFTRPDDASHLANAFTDPLVLPKFHPIQLANEPTHGVVALPIDKDMGTFESKYEVQFKPDAKPCKIPGGKLTTYLKANQTCGTRSSPTKPLRWRSEASLAQPRFACCICHAQRCTCLSTTRSRGYHRSGPISTVTGTRSIPLHGLVSDGETTKTGKLNLAVSVIHADVGELEVITQVEVFTNDKLPWSGQPTRPPAPLEIRSQVGSPQTSPRIAFPRDSLGESTAAPKSVTLNMSSTTKIDLTHTSATGKKAVSEVTQPSTHSSQADRKDMESIPPPVEFAITSAHDQPTADELMTEQHSYTQSNDTRSCDATECAGRINSPGQPANMEDNNANRNVFSRSSWYDQRYPAYTHGPGDNGARTTETEASSPVFIPVDGNNCGASEAYSSSESKSRHCEGARTNTTALITVLDESNSNVNGTLSLVHQDHQKNAAVASTSATQPLGASREEGGDTSCLDYSDTESTEENEGPSLSTRAVRLNTSRSARYFNTHCLHIRHAPFSSTSLLTATNYLALGAAGPIPAKSANQSVFPVKKYPYELTNGVSRELAQGLSLHCSLVACAHPAPERKQVLFHPIVGNRYGTSCGISTKRQVLPEEGHRRHQVLGHRDFRGLGQQRKVEIWLAHAGIMDTITPLFLSGYSANTSLDSLLVRTLLPIFTGSCSTVFDFIDYETEETCSSNSGKIRPQHPASNDLLTIEFHQSREQLMPSQELKPLFVIEVNSCDVQPLHIIAEFKGFEGSIRILPVREFILPNTQDGVLVKETACSDFILTPIFGDYANMELTHVSTWLVTNTHTAKPMLVSKFAVEIMFRHAQTADTVYPLTVGKENPITCFSSDVKPRNWIAAERECAIGWSSAFTWNNETWLNYCKMTGSTRNLSTHLGVGDTELTGHVTVIDDSISCSVQNYVNGKMKDSFPEVHHKCTISFHGQVVAQKQSLELDASLLIHGRPSVLTHEVLPAMEKAAEFPSVSQCACLAMNRYLECDTVKVTERLDVVATYFDKTAVSGASQAEVGCSLELVPGRILETTNLTSVCGTSRLKIGNEFTDAIFTELSVQFENQYTSDSGVTHKLYYLSDLGVGADDDHTDSHFSTTLSFSNPAFKRCPMTKESNSPNEEHSVWSSFSQTYTSSYDDSMFRAPLYADIFGSCTQVIRTNPIRINKNMSECERVEGAQNDGSVRFETNIEKLPMRIFGFAEHVQCRKMSSGEASLSVFGFVPCTQVLSQRMTFDQKLPRFNLNTALINTMVPNGDTILFSWSNFCPILVGQSRRSTSPTNMLTGFENNAYLWQFASSSCNLIFTEERYFRLFSEVAVRVKCSRKIEVRELTVFWFYAQDVLQSVLSHVKESSYSTIKNVTPCFLKFKDPKRTDHLEDHHKELPKLYTHVSRIIASTDDNLIQMIHEQSPEIVLPSANILCHVKRLLRPLIQMNALRFEMHIDSTMEEKDRLDLDASPEVRLGRSDAQRACLGDSSPRLEAINLLDASLVHDLLDGGDSLQMFEGSALIAHMVGEYLEDFSLLHPEKHESTTPSISCILCREKQLGFGIQIGGQQEILTNSAYEYSVDFGNWQSEISVNPHSVSNLNFCDCITSLLVPCSFQSNPCSNTAPDGVIEEGKLYQMVQLGHVSEQYMPLFPPQSSSNRLHLHTPRVTKLLRKALETPSNTQDAYHHPTVQTIQPLLKVHAFMQLIRNQLFPRQADSFRRQSLCAIRVCVLNTYTKEFECCSSHQAHHSTPATMNWICTILICSQFSQLAPHDQLQVEGEQSPGTQWLHLNGFGAITAVFRAALCVSFGKTFNSVTTSNKWAYVASQGGTRSITMCKQPELVYRSPTGKAKHPIGIPEIKRKDSLSIRSSMQDTSLTLSIHQHDKRDYYRRHTCTKVSALNDGEHMVFRRGTTLGQTSKMKVSTEVPSRLTKKVSTYSNDRTTTPKDTDSPKHGMRMYEKKSSRRRWSTSPIRSTGSGCKHIGVQTVHDTQTRISGASSKSRSWVSGDMRELNGQLRVEEPPGEIQRKTPKLSDETTPYLEKLRQRVKRRHRSTSRTLSSLSAKESEITETDTSELAALRISPHTSHLLPVSYRRGSLPLGVNLNILRRGRDTVRQVTMKYNTTIPHVTGSSNPTFNPTTLRKRPGQRKDDGNDTIGNIAIRDRATLWASRIRVGQRLLGNNKLQSPLPATKMVHHSQPPPPTGSSNLKVSSLTRSPAKCDPPENTKKGYLHTTRFKTGVSAPAPIQPIVSPKRDANIPRRIPDKKQPLRSLDQTTVAQRPVSRTMKKEKLKHL